MPPSRAHPPFDVVLIEHAIYLFESICLERISRARVYELPFLASR